MLAVLKQSLAQELARTIRARFEIDHEPSVETPPRRELGDLAFPAPLHLARALKKNPRSIAQELCDHFRPGSPVREVRVEGAGYLNVFLDRGALAARWLEEEVVPEGSVDTSGKTIVEHTNINPNKAAHIGHLRNAVLGDILVRTLRALGHTVEVQNYIDDTGVQLADVVVGFVDLRHRTVAEVAALGEPFDYTCWDLYAEVGRWYAAGEPGGEDRGARRRETLHALERATGERAEMGRLIAERIVGRHLTTMARLDIGYDLLTHESHILGLEFFSSAFERLKESGAIRLEEAGKNQGCWVMPLSESAEFEGLQDPDKVIVRSDGTVTYVGKDIAYQLWKFGLLGRDFAYRYRMDRGLWTTALVGADEPPRFGHATRVINVIDARQSYLQKIVRAGLEALGHHDEAARSVHFAYEMVSLSQAAAKILGVAGDDEAGEKKTLEMSGRKGIGVKADDLLDQVIAKAKHEIQERDRDLDHAAVEALSRQIAVAAVRYFMVKQTTTRVIAFDFDEALSFEGDSGPYLQYSAVRARNILKKMSASGLRTRVTAEEIIGVRGEAWDDDLWDLMLTVAQSAEVLERAASTLELSLVARQALELAQKFNAVYHRHPVVQEPDETLRIARLTAVLVFLRGLETLSGVLGIPLPQKM